MPTFMAKPGQVAQRWFVIDATDQVVGRLAVQIANILRGKHRPEYTPHVDTGELVLVGTGRRKTAVARVRLVEGSGQISINGRGLEDFFTEIKDRNAVTGPLDLTEMRNRVDVVVTVQGGGFTGQGGAICQGIARALKDM